MEFQWSAERRDRQISAEITVLDRVNGRQVTKDCVGWGRAVHQRKISPGGIASTPASQPGCTMGRGAESKYSIHRDEPEGHFRRSPLINVQRDVSGLPQRRKRTYKSLGLQSGSKFSGRILESPAGLRYTKNIGDNCPCCMLRCSLPRHDANALLAFGRGKRCQHCLLLLYLS